MSSLIKYGVRVHACVARSLARSFSGSTDAADIRNSIPVHLRPKILDEAAGITPVDEDEELQSYWSSMERRLQFRKHIPRDETNKDRPSRGRVGVSAWDGGGLEYVEALKKGEEGK
jgi:hypothetical protein